MRGRSLPQEIAPWIESALRLIGVDPDQVPAYWEEEGDAYRILVAVPIGLLTYRFVEIPGRFNDHEAVLAAITPWSEVHPKVETTTRWDRVAKVHLHRLELQLEGHLVKTPATVRSLDPDTGLAEFAAECLRRTAPHHRAVADEAV